MLLGLFAFVGGVVLVVSGFATKQRGQASCGAGVGDDLSAQFSPIAASHAAGISA